MAIGTPRIDRREFGRGVLAVGGTLATAGRNALAAPPAARMVFAHYMVCCPMAGLHAGVSDLRDEIRQAQSRGIDGFVLNCGNWTKEPKYPTITTRIFDAAVSLGTDFKLFFSADNLPLDDTVVMISEFYNHPNMFRYEGRPVLSTFGGNDETGKTLLVALTAAGKPVTFVPFFYPKGRDKRFSDANVAQLIAENSYVDGYFWFGAGGRGDEIARLSLRIGQAWQQAGKLYMAPVTPYYRGLGPDNYRGYESRGFEGMALQWEAAIAAGAQWVEIVTWNDWGESTYVGSFGLPNDTEIWANHWGPLLSHEGYLAASEYYIRWFKTGVRRIDGDNLYWFYRLAPRSQPGRPLPGNDTLGFPAGVADFEDRIFASAFLTQPAQVRIESGDQRYEFSVPQGVHHLSAEFTKGPQRFLVERDGRTVLVGDGAFSVADDNWANFNYLSGQAQPT
jgi:hypothetical protein